MVYACQALYQDYFNLPLATGNPNTNETLDDSLVGRYKGGMYLQIPHAAKRLGCSRQWVYVLLGRGVINAATILGRKAVVEDDHFKALEKARKHD